MESSFPNIENRKHNFWHVGASCFCGKLERKQDEL